ncbi:uncharacterized protein [Bemisia tabaci]|uniref:uncharacterized protein n=1 Tax=Bemisia tabaci TaxID=7038 RepID=UPI003B2891DF
MVLMLLVLTLHLALFVTDSSAGGVLENPGYIVHDQVRGYYALQIDGGRIVYAWRNKHFGGKAKIILESLDTYNGHWSDKNFRSYKPKDEKPKTKTTRTWWGKKITKVTVKRIGKVGVDKAIEWATSQKELYYSSSRCHSLHYVDYFVYGTTFGAWYTPWYLPACKECPVHERLYPEKRSP